MLTASKLVKFIADRDRDLFKFLKQHVVDDSPPEPEPERRRSPNQNMRRKSGMVLALPANRDGIDMNEMRRAAERGDRSGGCLVPRGVSKAALVSLICLYRNPENRISPQQYQPLAGVFGAPHTTVFGTAMQGALTMRSLIAQTDRLYGRAPTAR